MLQTLIESKASPQRWRGGAMLSFAVHAAVAAVVVWATARTSDAREAPEVYTMRYVTPTPVTTAMPRAPLTSARSALGAPPSETVAPPLLELPITAPTPDIGGAIGALGAWPASPSPSGAGASTGGSDGGNPAPSEFAAWQVEKAAMAVPGTATPRYPDLLRSSGVEGEAVVTFVVDTTGAADVSTFRVLHATHELFALAVRSALPRMRFVPAEVGGRKVRQIVQQPFVFAVQR